MAAASPDRGREPSRAEIEGLPGPVLLEFGTSWCGHCRSLAPALASILGALPEVRHVKIEDGPGLPLGRSYGVKLWPTLVFLKDGRILEQVARPGLAEVRKGLEAIRSPIVEDEAPSEPIA